MRASFIRQLIKVHFNARKFLYHSRKMCYTMLGMVISRLHGLGRVLTKLNTSVNRKWRLV